MERLRAGLWLYYCFMSSSQTRTSKNLRICLFISLTGIKNWAKVAIKITSYSILPKIVINFLQRYDQLLTKPKLNFFINNITFSFILLKNSLVKINDTNIRMQERTYKFYLADWSFSKLYDFYPIMSGVIQGVEPIIEFLVLVQKNRDPTSSLLITGNCQET